MTSPFKLLTESGLVRRNFIAFALISAAINGLVTATVGAWLAQTYAAHQSRRASVQGIADLIYERRARGGMVVSSMRRAADLDELRYRKRAYDEVFVEWNRKLQTNILQIREVMGRSEASGFEAILQDQLVPQLAVMDGCLTKAYDTRVGGGEPMPIVDACRYPMLHQFVLDCAASLTDELYRASNLSFLAFRGPSPKDLAVGLQRVKQVCTAPAEPAPQVQPSPLPPAAPPTPPSEKGN